MALEQNSGPELKPGMECDLNRESSSGEYWRWCPRCGHEQVVPDQSDEAGPASSVKVSGAAKPTPAVVLTGGDPLERPDFWEILDYARKIGLHVDVEPPEYTVPAFTTAIVRYLAEHPRVTATSAP